MRTNKPSAKPRISKIHKIHEQYRRLLKRPKLKSWQIEAMRKHVMLLARTICEHVWGEKFY